MKISVKCEEGEFFAELDLGAYSLWFQDAFTWTSDWDDLICSWGDKDYLLQVLKESYPEAEIKDYSKGDKV